MAFSIEGNVIKITRGDTAKIIVSARDKDGGIYEFKAGDTIYLTVKKSVHTEENLIQIIVRDFVDGKAEIKLLPKDTKNLSIKSTYQYDVQLNTADGEVNTIIPPNNFIVESEVTYE